ncbi:L-threonylcarbamoyladenylate synthase [Numidum massiliense]|uniref:L-threonylcarbamoyladenylate synthase n=1 Tax=Numidum massiliense TaxID=1522315 RepID=UPI0006D543FD|nr:L-threonylcarbamoyladenylate synthase [Numidum massiliense]
METIVWKLSAEDGVQQLLQHRYIEQAAAALRRGELVAFPTETVYGLGADATNDDAVAAIFAAKGRPSDNPLIAHIGSHAQLETVVSSVPPVAERLIERFWPGPLTLVLPSAGTVSRKVTAGLATVAVRMPSHPIARALLQQTGCPVAAPSANRSGRPSPIARALLQQTGCPVAAPSANRSGRPSPTDVQHVLDDLAGRIYVALDGGETGYGLESTVLDVTESTPVVLRPGGITLEELRDALGDVQVDPFLQQQSGTPRSPGLKYRHYAPRGEMTLVKGKEREMVTRIRALTEQYQREGWKVGVLTTAEHRNAYEADVVIACGQRSELSTVAHGLYRALREFDEVGVERVLAETFPEVGDGATIMNRLRKAAGGRII